MHGRLAHCLAVLAALWVVILPAEADQYTPPSPSIPLGPGVGNALGIGVGNVGSPFINNGTWVDPVLSYNASGLNTTGVGAISAGSNTLTTTFIINGLTNGMSIAVTGAGAAGAILNTTLTSGAGTVHLVLGANASTAVGAASSTGSINSGSNALTTSGVITGISNGMTISVLAAGAALPSGYPGTLNTTVVSGEGTTSLVLANAAGATVSGAGVSTVGATVYTYGSITSGTGILNVISTAGWLTGQGIDVTGAGSAGADLITTVTVTSPTVLTLGVNAATTVTNAKINHDDTAAINAALTTTQNVQLPPGQFNVTGTLNIAYPQWVQCAGAGVGTIPGFASPTPLGGTIIWNRGKTNNVINISSQQAHLMDCGIMQAADVIPTAGYCIQVGSGNASVLLNAGWIERNICYNEYQLFYVNEGLSLWDISHNQFSGGQLTNNTMVVHQNHWPAGDNAFVGNSIVSQVTLGLNCLHIIESDTQVWTNNKFNVCNPNVLIDNQSEALNQNFVGNSFENFGPLGAVVISGGQNIMFTGNQFGADHGFPEFTISGSAGPGVIVGNIMTNATSGVPYTNTSSDAYQWTYAANQDNTRRPSQAARASGRSAARSNGAAAFAIKTGTGTCTSAALKRPYGSLAPPSNE